MGAKRWGGTLYEWAAGEASSYHWQMGEEECAVVVFGTPTLRTPDGERVLQPWECVWFVRGPDGAHGFRNDTDEPVRVVMFSTVSDPELVVYPDDDKIGVIAGWTNENVETVRGWVEPA
jgi:uncharacterized cupin superfamily protein